MSRVARKGRVGRGGLPHPSHPFAFSRSLFMASSLLALIDDIASLLDDMAVLSKVAAKKTTGVIGDDLALNAKQASGVSPERELPVVWAVAKGSLLNKLILVPTALLISAFAPSFILPLLMIGGVYLCFEGFEKLAHKFLHSEAEHASEHAELVAAVADPKVDLVAYEREKIRGAIRTDFILSAEIVVIALGTMATEPINRQIVALSAVALAVTVLVYGLVAAIVKLDDLGLKLHQLSGTSAGIALQRRIGGGILIGAPYLMKTLSVLGTAAMFTVGGSIIVHGIGPLEHFMTGVHDNMAARSAWLGTLANIVLEAAVGLAAGAASLAVVMLIKRIVQRAK